MTNLDKLFDSLWATTVGFDPMFTTATRRVESFPFYDIFKKDNDNYSVEVALAGYGPDDIEINWLPGNLTISTVQKTAEEKPARVYHGIAKRSFKLSFPLAQYVEVGRTEFEHGMLRIDLVRNVPEAAKPRKIAIGYDAQQALIDDAKNVRTLSKSKTA